MLARKYLEAKDKMDRGDSADMVAFHNSTLGKTWEYTGELPEEDSLRERAEPYAEWTCPAGGLYPTITVDVQHDRLAVTAWVYGRGEERWLAFWGEFYGSTMVAHEGAWIELAQALNKTVLQTSDAVYSFVRKYNIAGRPVLAVKGASDSVGRIEIWTPPRKVDPNARSTKASRSGVTVHIVGTAKAKDLILGFSENAGQIRLEGDGPGRMHWYQGVRDDFYVQILSEIKIPRRDNPAKREWKVRTDRRNEGLDCTVYATYLYRALRLNLQRPSYWDALELQLRQAPLLPPADEPDAQRPLVVQGALPQAQAHQPDQHPASSSSSNDNIFEPIDLD